ncbi:universal stress protein [Streptomyces sp. NPDC046924]|uniref:universal stress protein n=1 Tax=Streptomyces sp. NPDC046924 TaxID=3155136 RepID=UPI0034048DC1
MERHRSAPGAHRPETGTCDHCTVTCPAITPESGKSDSGGEGHVPHRHRGSRRLAREPCRRRGGLPVAGCPWRPYGPGGARRTRPPPLLPQISSGGHPLSAVESTRTHEERAAEELRTARDDVPGGRRGAAAHRRRAPCRALLNASHQADLLVVGARRRDGHGGLQLGRVAHGLLHHSACPVAVVPHREGDA